MPNQTNPDNNAKHFHKFKTWLLKPYIAGLITLILLAGAAWAGYSYWFGQVPGQPGPEDEVPTEVTVASLETESGSIGRIKAVGRVKPESKVDVPAMAKGTVRRLNFEVGDRVQSNTTLAVLYDSATQANLVNAQTHVDNMRSNLLSVERLAEESILQAKIGVQSAEETVQSAQIALESAQDNLENARSLRQKNDLDAKQSAVVSFDNYLNTVYNALEQTDRILGVEDGPELPGIEQVLGVKDLSSVDKAKRNYRQTNNAYQELKNTTVTTDNITGAMQDMAKLLGQTNRLVNDMVTVLDNTITSSGFPQSALDKTKGDFTALRSTVVNVSQNAQSSLNQLENLGLTYEKDIESLENAVKSAKIQLQSALTQKKNAEARLENARKNKEQQLVSARTSLDNAKGQLRLAQIQASDLTVKSPISGKVTQKYTEQGAELSTGQPVAEVSQTDMLLIEIEVSPDEVKQLNQGQKVTISSEGKDHTGRLNRIYPAAETQNRKVKAEIVFDNSHQDLIPESYVDVYLPLQKPEKASPDSIYIPLKSVFITPTENYVFLAQDNRARKQTVKLGQTTGNQIEITQGLSPGDRLIIDGAKNLEDGEAITVVKQ